MPIARRKFHCFSNTRQYRLMGWNRSRELDAAKASPSRIKLVDEAWLCQAGNSADVQNIAGSTMCQIVDLARISF
jgi:hypothetical protein